MHWRSTANILQTGKLFTANNLLPISPLYPGLEEVTSALASITGLSVFASGLIVAGTAHLLFVCVLFVLFRHVSGSHRVAGVAVLLYASESLFQSFDSMFVYQTLAVPFLGLTVLAVWRLAAPQTGQQPRRLVHDRACCRLLATVVTHHVTSYVLVATLEVITLGALFARTGRGRLGLHPGPGVGGGVHRLDCVRRSFDRWAICSPSSHRRCRPSGLFSSGGHSGAPPPPRPPPGRWRTRCLPRRPS